MMKTKGLYAFLLCCVLSLLLSPAALTVPADATEYGDGTAYRREERVSRDETPADPAPDTPTAELAAGDIIASGECGADGDNVTWTLDSDGTLTISGKGEMENFSIPSKSPPWYNYRSNIKNALIQSGITTIGDFSFFKFENLTDVDIAIGVQTIGHDAFYDCVNLSKINISYGVRNIGTNTFHGCVSLSNINLPDSLTVIKERAFQDCINLLSISIPDSVTGIGFEAFQNCLSLTKVDMSNRIQTIAESLFSGCENLNNITIPDSVTKIIRHAFYGCKSLTKVNIPNSVTTIGTNPFCNCNNLLSIEVDNANISYCSDNGILFSKDKTAIISYPGGKPGSYAIPNGVTDIGNSAFDHCDGLTSVTIPDSITSIGNSAFWCCSGLTSVTIPNSVTEIGSSAFWSCSGLTSVTIPNSVTKIGSTAFYGCSSLTSVTIPDSVIEIGSTAFYGCSSLTSVTIPDSVIEIGSGAFSGCNNLKDVYYADTEEEWKAISIAGGNEPLTNAFIHYNSGGESSVSDVYITPMEFGSMVNGAGYAVGWFRAADAAGNPLSGVPVQYRVSGASVSGQAVSDGNGFIGVRSPRLTEAGGHTFTVQFTGQNGVTVHGGEQSFSATVKELSYTQSWSGGISGKADVGLRSGVVKASGKGKAGIEFSISDEHDNGKRTLSLEQEGNIGGGIDFKAGIDTKELSDNEKFTFLNLSSGVDYSYTHSNGLVIPDYNPQDHDQRVQVGTFVLLGAIGLKQSVMSDTIRDWLNVEICNKRSVSHDLKVNGKAGVLNYEWGSNNKAAVGGLSGKKSVGFEREQDYLNGIESVKSTEKTNFSGGLGSIQFGTKEEEREKNSMKSELNFGSYIM